MIGKTVEINQKALQALHKGDLYTAQTLFRENVKRDRCALTWQNLGVFYGENNILDENLRERDGRRLALRLLSKAAAEDASGKAAFAMGNVYEKLGNHAQAAVFFERSLSSKRRFAAVFNRGVCLFNDRAFAEAAASFEEARYLANTEERTDVTAALAYAKIFAQKPDAAEYAQEIFRIRDDSLLYDQFVLAYLLQDEAHTAKYVLPAVRHFSLGEQVLAMAIDALLLLDRREEANAVFRESVENLQDSAYNTSREEARLRRAYMEKDSRKALIAAYLPPFDLQAVCCYLDCPFHKD